MLRSCEDRSSTGAEERIDARVWVRGVERVDLDLTAARVSGGRRNQYVDGEEKPDAVCEGIGGGSYGWAWQRWKACDGWEALGHVRDGAAWIGGGVDADGVGTVERWQRVGLFLVDEHTSSGLEARRCCLIEDLGIVFAGTKKISCRVVN
ncbi:hypothetical protein M0R45_002146 [Rubus argutus]|uniref:Uncharacterized protein n=1 Tax=Rubus argutus TaxID=59490 RepID=A0AAW1VDY9_RUBAR